MRAPDWPAAQAAADALVAPWREGTSPGGAVLAFDAGGVRAEAAAGQADLATGAPFGPGTVIRYASVTKHVLAAIRGRHAEAVGLDDPLGRHLPELRGDMAAVTAGRALDMTGGLPDVRETLALLGLSVHTTTEAGPLLDFLAGLGALNFPAGGEISYSNTGYRLVEAALARAGLPFAAAMRAELADPLGLGWHAPEGWADIVPGLAPGYWKGEGGWQTAHAGLHLSASGSLAGSGRDLAAWGAALLAGHGPAAGILAAQSAPRHLRDGRETGYGLGLARGRLGGLALTGHGGSHAGYKTYLLLAPEAGLGVTVVANREDLAAHGAALRVLAALTGRDLPPPAALPEGLYAEPGTGNWLEVTPDGAGFLGATEALVRGEGGWAVSLSAHNPLRLRAVPGGGIEGEAGHVPRRFLPATPDDAAERLAGHWVLPEHHAALDIAAGRIAMGTGPARVSAPLRPLGEGRLLAALPDGPWRKAFSLTPEEDGLRVASHRSRILRYRRA